MGRSPEPSFRELLTAPPLVSAVFAGRFHSIGRDRVGPTIRAGQFPVEVIESVGKKVCTKTALIRSLGVSPADVVVLAEMEATADKYAPSKPLARDEKALQDNDFGDEFGEEV